MASGDEARHQARLKQAAQQRSPSKPSHVGVRDRRSGLWSVRGPDDSLVGFGPRPISDGQTQPGQAVQVYPRGQGHGPIIIGPMATPETGSETVQPPPIGYLRGQIFNEGKGESESEDRPTYLYFDSNWLGSAESEAGDRLLIWMLRGLRSRKIYQPESWSGTGFYPGSLPQESPAIPRSLRALNMTLEVKPLAAIRGPIFLPLITPPPEDDPWLTEAEVKHLNRICRRYGGLLTGEWNAFTTVTGGQPESKTAWYWLNLALLKCLGLDPTEWPWKSSLSNWDTHRAGIVQVDATGSFSVPPGARSKARPIGWTDDGTRQWATILKVKPGKPIV